MDNYVAIVYNKDTEAYEGLHSLWNLDHRGEITVHGASVIHRDEFGKIHVATKQTDPGVRTAMGVGIGLLLGALAGPIGAAAGATIAAGTAAGIGAAAGGLAGLTADSIKAGEHEQAARESASVIKPRQYAVVAEVTEYRTSPIDTMASEHLGKVFRRPTTQIRTDSFGDEYYPGYLYPYDYDPYFVY